MPTRVRERLRSVGGGHHLKPLLEIECIELTVDKNGRIVDRYFVLENTRRYLEKDLIFEEVDADELLALDVESKIMATKLPHTAEYIAASRRRSLRKNQ